MSRHTKVREGLSELLDTIRENIDHFEMLETIEDRMDSALKALQKFNTISGITEGRKELPYHLAEIRVISDILVFKLSMHMGEFEERLDEITKEYIELFPSTKEENDVSDENWDDLDF